MTQDSDHSAMRRKAGAGRPPPEIGRATPATALRVAVAQAAEDVAALIALAAGVEETRTVRASFIEGLPEHALLALCEGVGGRFGMVVMDPQALAALIEIQTTGRVVPHKAEPRAPTRTDAILSADFINRMLELFAELVAEAELPVLSAIEGFSYALPLADTRAVEMTLEDIPYRQFTLTLDMGSGAKEGQMQLLFPFDPPRRRLSLARDDDGETVAEAVMDTQAEMTAVLHRLDLSLTAVMQLEVGALVPIPKSALTQLTLEGVTGEVVSRGRLGQIGGHRAVRVHNDLVTGVEVEPGLDMPSAPAPMPSLPTELPPIDGLPPPGQAMPAMGDAELPPLADAAGLPPLGDMGDLPPLGGEGDLPPLGGGGDLPPLGGGSDLPPLGAGGDLPPLDAAPMALGDLPEPVG